MTSANVSAPSDSPAREAIQVDGGAMTVTVVGAQDRPRPALVLLHEIFGANYAMRELAQRFASWGYLVVIPDLFHRAEPNVELDYVADDRPRAMALLQGLDFDRTMQDIRHAVAWSANHPSSTQRVGLVGFCLGGRLALLAAENPQVTASVAFYPVKMQAHRGLMQGMKTPVQVHVGDRDSHVPSEVLQMIQQDLSRDPHEVFIYEGAEHAFFNPHHPGYGAAAADVANGRAHAFLNRHFEL